MADSAEVNQRPRRYEHARQGATKPPRLPPSGLHHQRKTGALIVPHAVVVCRDDAKAVVARRQAEETGHPLFAHFPPVLIEAFQRLLEAHPLRRSETQPGVTNLHAPPPRRHGEDCGLRIGDCGFAVHQHFLDYHWRRHGVGWNLARVHHAETLHRSEPQAAVVRPQSRRLPRRALLGSESVAPGVRSTLDPFFLPTNDSLQLRARHAEDPAIGAEPEVAQFVVENNRDASLVQGLARVESGDVAVAQQAEAAHRANPERTIGLSQEGPHGFVRQAVGERCESSVFEPVQPAGDGPDPKSAGGVLGQCAHVVAQ